MLSFHLIKRYANLYALCVMLLDCTLEITPKEGGGRTTVNFIQMESQRVCMFADFDVGLAHNT